MSLEGPQSPPPPSWIDGGLAPMDFANEPFVRLYVRDTSTWNQLGFAGQTTLMHLLRRANLAGTIYLMGEPWQAAVSLCGVPEAIAKAGCAKLLEHGCVVLEGTRLTFPRYVEAQTAAASAALRQQESRARKVLAEESEDHYRIPKRWEQPADASQNVTDSDLTVWDPVFGAKRRAPAPQVALAARGAKWLSDATGMEPWALGGRWAAALAELGRKPDAERQRAAPILKQCVQQGRGAFLTPQHVVDYWTLYKVGQAPGGAPAARNGSNGHHEPPTAPPEIEQARAESERCKRAYETARTEHERNLASAKWLEADRKLKSARERSGWNG